MKKRLTMSIMLLLCFGLQNAWADLEMGKAPKTIVLQEKLGGHLDGRPWSSEEIKGKVSVLFYVDPDEKDLNNDASEALKQENFSLEKYQSFAVINMAATWLPNFAISSSLEEKQKIYKTTIYVRDYKKALVKEWGLADDTSDVLVFDKSGNLVFRKDGQLNQEEIKMLVKAVHDHLEQ